LPLDLVVYEEGKLQSDRIVCIEENNPYFMMLRRTWGGKLREVFDSLEDPQWNGGHTDTPLKAATTRSIPLKKITTPEEKLI
jgi:putative proteasome-type protease